MTNKGQSGLLPLFLLGEERDIMLRLAKVGVWLDGAAAEKRWRYGQNVFELYMEEILAHAGIPFRRLTTGAELTVYSPDVLLVALAGESDAALEELLSFVRSGGTLISYAGLNRLAGQLGCRELAVRDAAYAELPEQGIAADGVALRALKVRPWVRVEAETATAQGVLRKGEPNGETIGAASLELVIGSGKLIRWNVNVPETIVRLQQGSGPVVEDGIPAADGTGTLDEGILKADDCCELDWELDRTETATGVPYYGVPYADLWREAMIGQLLRETLERGAALPFVDYWPEGVRQVAMISHDSDFNVDASAEATLEVLKENGVQSTWCMIEPGYSTDIYEKIKADGHELAFHYNALEKEDGIWDAYEFERQLEFIRSSTGEEVVSNKNHYTRYEGWGELFQWCEKNGIEADQTRGPSKKGNIGFLFGTCHPYYPIAWSDERNRTYNVLEIGFLTQDLEHPSLADTSVIDPFLDGVERVRGVAHFLFHQLHVLQQPKVREAMGLVVRRAKERGFTFMTSAQILRWEQARRRTVLATGEQGGLQLQQAPDGAVVWIPTTAGEGAEAVRFGVGCRKVVIGAGTDVQAAAGREA